MTFPAVFGFKTNESRNGQVMANYMNVAGYSSIVGYGILIGGFKVTLLKFIPIIAVAGGIFRILVNINQNLDWRADSTLKGHVLRGVAEIVQLGPILFIVDIFATFCFKSNAKKPATTM